jgi:hypothetical protein
VVYKSNGWGKQSCPSIVANQPVTKMTTGNN